MRELIYIPIVMALIFGTVTQLFETAEATSDKIEVYTGDMVNAVDCAIAAIPLEACSPNIYGYEFETEINDTLNLTQRLELEFRHGDI